jgi:hypothetical protein
MNARSRVFLLLVLAGAFAFKPSLLAHAPFDSTSRVIVHEASIEVTVTVGSALGEDILRAAQLDPRRLPNEHPHAMDTTAATNFFAVSAGQMILISKEADVVSDGIEFQFHFEYPLGSATSLRLQSLLLDKLPTPRQMPLAVTDENGNMLASAILSQGNDALGFNLPEALVPKTSGGITVDNPISNPPSEAVSESIAPPRIHPSFTEFLKLGIEHILTGYDHLLFLLALLLGCRALKPMLWVITGFTLAHSLTLALAALNVVAISPRVVEPAIALSIILVAAENFHRKEKHWQRYAITCGFGLIHGFGFAGALRSAGLAGSGAQVIGPLFSFNLGVEIGQLAVATVIVPLLISLRRRPWFARYGAMAISTLVIAVAALWFWQRVTHFGD